jgi:hypothetical protein
MVGLARALDLSGARPRFERGKRRSGGSDDSKGKPPMPRKRPLKVYRTSIGFHDAYVAATSRKAALEAWGADNDLFGIGAAEVVEDPDLTAEPLAKPGTVIRRLRASPEEHLAAAGPSKSRPQAPAERPRREPRAARRKPTPPPKRTALDKAEAALAAFEQQAAADLAELRQKEEALHRQRIALEQRRRAEAAKLEKRVASARTRYEQAMEVWRRQTD